LTRFISLVEFLWLAEQVTGIDAEVLAMSSRINPAGRRRSGSSDALGGGAWG